MSSNIVFGQMVNYYRKQNNMTMEDLGEVMGKTKSTVSRWVSGERYPKIEEVEKLAGIFNVDIETILFGGRYPSNITTIYNQLEPPRQKYVYDVAEQQLEEQNKVINLSDFINEDLYGYASAGTGQQVFDNPVETIQLHKSDVPSQHYDLVLQVVGDSMEPAFKDGEYIFIRKTENLRNGQFGVFIINGESYLKKVYVEDDHLRLVSLNEKYEDLIFTEDDGITLVGQVVL